MFKGIESRKDEHGLVSPNDLQELRIFRGGRGIWWDKEITSGFFTPGATVSLLHTGRHYDDDLEDDFAFYHYPVTKQSTHDSNDIECTRVAMENNIPLFYIIYRGDKREVRLAFVEMDDERDLFLIRFGQTPKPFQGQTLKQVISEPFSVSEPKVTGTTNKKVRPNQKVFAIAARKYYGTICAFCGLDVPILLDAAHIIPYEKDGPNDPRNSLMLCPTHHRAFDEGLVYIDPKTLDLVPAFEHTDLESAGIFLKSLAHLINKPHPAAITWRWENPAPHRPKLRHSEIAHHS